MELLRFELLLPSFGLVLARVAGLVLAVPMLASAQIPRTLMAGFAIVVSLMVFPVVAPLLPESLTLGQAAAGMVTEFIIGEALGLAAGAVFFAAQIAGQLISHQSGLALGQVFNPLFDEQSTVIDQLWFFATMILFFMLRGHLAVTQALLESFRDVPPLMLHADAALGEFAMSVCATTFQMALRLAGPAVLALLLTSVVMGFLTKTMPQLNIFSVGFSLKIIVAFLVAAISIAHSGGLVARGFEESLDDLGELMQVMSARVIHAG